MAKRIVVIAVVFSMLATAFVGSDFVSRTSGESGYEGISWSRVVPVKKVTFVKFDENSFIDDYAFLAAIPTAVFYKDGKLYSHPLLFYNDFVPSSKEELSLNDSQGIKYFMEDWQGFCNGVDEIESINAGRLEWNAYYSYINSSDYYDMASKIALSHWKSSNSCVVAYAGDFLSSHNISGEMTREIDGNVKRIAFTLPEPEGIGGVYKDFDVDEPYIYIDARVEWNPLLRGHDIDLQLYDEQLGMVDASENWNAMFGTHEEVGSYVFHHGKWKVGLTNMPTEDIKDIISEVKTVKGTYNVNVTMYSGSLISIGSIPFKATDFEISIECDENISFGAFIISNGIPYEPYKGNGNLTIKMDEAGAGNYSLCIFLHDDGRHAFHISYSWKEQGREQTDSFASASQAAILASILDVPLLYIAPHHVPSVTKNTIEELGVEHIIAIGTEKFSIEGCSVEYYSIEDAYSKIMELTGKNDVVFTTTSPWTYWLVGDLSPHGDKSKAMYVAPAAYLAAHHGVPLLVTDEHPQLSNSVSWVTDFWKRDSLAREPPSPGCMYLMAKQVYDFLSMHNFDREGKENIVTVAGQFDIGIGWDRAFVGKANPGRILGTPVDASMQIARAVFYPAIIFENPAVGGEVNLINGSSSERGFAGRLRIVKPSMEESFSYPVLNTWVSYCHNFNKEASKYWGCMYTTRDGITPYVTPSPNPIDEGATDKLGAYWPDMSTSEVVPFYLKKLGYSIAFSTNFTATMSNLNRGVIMWFEGMHAGHWHSGGVGFWDPDANWSKMLYLFNNVPVIGKIIENKKITTEPNPWRGYEFGLWRQAFFRWGAGNIQTQIFQTGSTADPDVMVMDKWLGWDFHGGRYGDGVVIAILQQVETEIKSGYEIDAALKNLHSCGINAGISCYISSTYLHLTLIRHGSIFQIIDPWLTSWYANFAVEMFARYLALGYTAGEAYEKSMEHVGIGYLTKEWWWDVSENICYFGDPAINIWNPEHAWEKPSAVSPGEI